MRVIHLLKIEFSKLGTPAIEGLIILATIQPWLISAMLSITGIGGTDVTSLAEELIRMAVIGSTSRIFGLTTLIIAGYLSYSVSTDFNSGLTQTILSYPVSRRLYYYSKLLAIMLLVLVPAIYSTSVWTAAIIEEKPILTPLHLIIACFLTQFFPIGTFTLLICVSIKRNFFLSLFLSLAPWFIGTRIEVQGKVKYVFPWNYPEAFATGMHIIAILSSLTITFTCLSIIEFIFTRLEVTE